MTTAMLRTGHFSRDTSSGKGGKMGDYGPPGEMKPAAFSLHLRSLADISLDSDWSDKNRQQCNSMYAKFLPLIGLHSDNFTTTHDVRWESSAGIRRSDLVCAAQGA